MRLLLAALCVVAVGGCRQLLGIEGAELADPRTIIDATDAVTDIQSDASLTPPALAGLRWLLPCSAPLTNNNCQCSPVPIAGSVTLAGAASERWTLTIQIRGVMEAGTFINGLPGVSGWYAGGAPGTSSINAFGMTISSPSQTYWLNRGTPTNRRSFAYDYTVTITVDGDATVTFTSNGQDGQQWGNYDENSNPIMLPGVTTTPDPYDGQFARLDVIGYVLQ